MDKGNPKEPMRAVDTWQERALSLDPSWTKPVGWERRKEGEEKIEREKLYLLSKFPGDQTVGFWRSKRQSASPQRELQAETETRSFDKLQEVGVSLLLGLFIV